MITMRTSISMEALEKYPDDVQARLPDVVKKHAFALQARTMASPALPVDTGALKNSIKARAVNKLVWNVEDGVLYGVFQELGTSRGVPARHFLGGASEASAKPFFDDIGKAMQP